MPFLTIEELIDRRLVNHQKQYEIEQHKEFRRRRWAALKPELRDEIRRQRRLAKVMGIKVS